MQKNRDGKTPLLLAVENDSYKIGELLISKGADTNAKNIHNWTLLHIALDMGSTEMSKLLILSGADLNTKI